MITVIASIHVKPGHLSRFMDIFKANVPLVMAENGCMEYYPAVDLETGLPVQEMDENAVTVIEKWENLDALLNHLGAPHMLSYRERVKDMVEKVVVKVLRPA
ncbi:MAG: antibiotic biosynthesis monooxygenase [Deltaproteobacteria bacterium]|nr:antibiotic biosynthesis monooxygenase [Deltaproteobacteria bacterium]MBW2110843.1 antibiotic biosynthesis monooxygenase [Deltaproteobacteria bacterium]MBW2352364.1 antibiotic biosynthesis monooxygenase [Deltaproteobacteria bacterium]